MMHVEYYIHFVFQNVLHLTRRKWGGVGPHKAMICVGQLGLGRVGQVSNASTLEAEAGVLPMSLRSAQTTE